MTIAFLLQVLKLFWKKNLDPVVIHCLWRSEPEKEIYFSAWMENLLQGIRVSGLGFSWTDNFAIHDQCCWNTTWELNLKLVCYFHQLLLFW